METSWPGTGAAVRSKAFASSPLIDMYKYGLVSKHQEGSTNLASVMTRSNFAVKLLIDAAKFV